MKDAPDYFEILARHARMQGGRIAVHCGEERISYSLLNENISRFGNILKKLGLQAKDRMMLAIPDGPDFFYAFFGAMKCGIWPVLMSPDLAREDYEYISRDTGAMALITVRESEAAAVIGTGIQHILCLDDEAYPSLLAHANAELSPYSAAPADISFLVYTSGSTGKPKGVQHRQSDMLYSARHYAGEVLQMSAADIIFSTSKLFFTYGMGNNLAFPLYHGAGAVLFPGKPGPADVLKTVEKYAPTILCCVPTLFNMLLKTLPGPTSFPSLRFCVSAGEALPAGTYRTWKELTGLEIIDGIGSTEAYHIFISNRPGAVRPGSSGNIVPGYEARIVGEDGQPVEEGRQGILHIRGKSTSPGYWNLPEKTAETMLPGGWLNTGDYYIEAGGCYTYQGRQDDLFKSGGAWVSPVKVEEALRSHPAILECAVTSRKLESLLRPMAHVVLNPGFSGDMKLSRELRDHVRRQLPDYMCPVQINFVEELPKTRTGKIQRYVLKVS